MPKESKWVEVAQGERNKPKELTSNVMGQESPQEAQKRPNKHGSNNTTARIAEWYNRNGSKITERAKNGLKRGKPTIKQGPALERSKPIKNEKLENISCHKKSRMSSRMHR